MPTVVHAAVAVQKAGLMPRMFGVRSGRDVAAAVGEQHHEVGVQPLHGPLCRSPSRRPEWRRPRTTRVLLAAMYQAVLNIISAIGFALLV